MNEKGGLYLGHPPLIKGINTTCINKINCNWKGQLLQSLAPISKTFTSSAPSKITFFMPAMAMYHGYSSSSDSESGIAAVYPSRQAAILDNLAAHPLHPPFVYQLPLQMPGVPNYMQVLGVPNLQNPALNNPLLPNPFLF